MLKVATPSLQAGQILASDYEPGKHYLKGAWPGVSPLLFNPGIFIVV